MTKKALYGSTDYPFVELGDVADQKAPRRSVRVIGYDRNKYVDVIVFAGGGVTITSNIKRAYVRPWDWKKRFRESRWERSSRYFSHKELCELPQID